MSSAMKFLKLNVRCGLHLLFHLRQVLAQMSSLWWDFLSSPYWSNNTCPWLSNSLPWLEFDGRTIILDEFHIFTCLFFFNCQSLLTRMRSKKTRIFCLLIMYPQCLYQQHLVPSKSPNYGLRLLQGLNKMIHLSH